MDGIALITGANRGIGLEIASQLALKGLHVIAAARDQIKAASAADQIARRGGKASAAVLDVRAVDKIPAAIEKLEAAHGPVAVLVNNAAVLIDEPGGFDARLFDLKPETVRQTFETNVLGPTALVQAILPGMMRRRYGRIVNMSSLAGQLTNMGGGFPAYRMSKAALNVLTRSAAAEAKGGGDIKVNSCSPGWVKTGMGGEDAPRSVEQGAETAVWLATLDANGPTGGFFHDKQAVPW